MEECVVSRKKNNIIRKLHTIRFKRKFFFEKHRIVEDIRNMAEKNFDSVSTQALMVQESKVTKNNWK
jgi:hypothetical protein